MAEGKSLDLTKRLPKTDKAPEQPVSIKLTKNDSQQTAPKKDSTDNPSWQLPLEAYYSDEPAIQITEDYINEFGLRVKSSDPSVNQKYRLNHRQENLLNRSPYYQTLKKKKLKKASLIFGTALSLIFIIVQGLVPLPIISHGLESSIVNAAGDGFNQFNQASLLLKDQKYTEAASSFKQANEKFNHSLSALNQTGQASNILPYLVSNQSYSTAQAMLIAAGDLSKAGEDASVLFNQFSAQLKNTSPINSNDPFDKLSAITTSLIGDQDKYLNSVNQISALLDHAIWVMTTYANSPVANHQLEEARAMMWQKLPALVDSAHRAITVIKDLPAILGQDRNRRYLVLFLNNTELRPGGGFLGSFASTILTKGKIDGFAVETNIYKLDNAFNKTAHIDPPFPINHIIPDWNLRDANWDVDFTSSAKKVAWFYKQEAGVDVDGVLSIDTSLLISLLHLTGPIEVPEQHVTVDENNFLPVVQYKVEKEYLTNADVRALNEPKKILADMFPLLMQHVMAIIKDNPSQLITTLSDAATEKHLLFSSFFEQGTEMVNATGSDNPFPNSNDFIMVNNGNLGGMKSSLNINQKIDVALEPTNRRTLIHTVTITRTHTGNGVWPDGDNHNFIRLVVPRQAVYIDSKSDGLEDNLVENDAQVEFYPNYQTFGRWLTTPIGQTKTAIFRYETPIEASTLGNDNYQLEYVKQPGWTKDMITISLKDVGDWHFSSPNKTTSVTVDQNRLFSFPLANNNFFRQLIDKII